MPRYPRDAGNKTLMTPMKKKLCVPLFAMFALSTMHAAEGDVITVTYAESGPTVVIPESLNGIVMSTVNGNHVVLQSTTTTEEYVYSLSGKTTDGSLTITGAYKLTLELNGVDITSQRGAAIDIETGKRVAVVLQEGTVNTLSDCSLGPQKAAMYFSGHPEFEGAGTLNVTGNTKHAISAKEELQIKATTGTINVLGAVSDGIHCGRGRIANTHNYFQMDGGIVNINNAMSDAIDSDDYGCMIINGGIINANVPGNEGAGLKCDSIFTMKGGTLNIVVSGNDAEGIRINYDAQLIGGGIVVNVSGNGSKGIKSKNKTASSTSPTVLNGGTLTFGGTECLFYVHCDNFTDETTGEVTKSRAVSADKEITRKAGNIDIFSYGALNNPFHSDSTTVVEGYGGTLTIHMAPWKFYYGDFQHDMTTYVELHVNETPVPQLSDYAIGAFMGDVCVGVAVDNYLRIYSNSLENSKVSFRVFDLTTEQPVPVVSVSRDVSFQAGSTAGDATNPIIINCSISLVGDINGDNQIDIADATAWTNTYKINPKELRLDIDNSGTVTRDDIKALVSIILTQ